MEPAGREERPGLALTALAAILVITAAWWALALWPAAAEPEWLTRTRAACFGSERGGLPATSGWILLIGEPLGMLGMLLAIGGRALRRDIAWLAASRWRSATALSIAAVAVVATVLLGTRVARAWEGGRAYAPDLSMLRSVEADPPSVALVDQHGDRISLAEWRGRPAIVTFAFGHCATVCPVVVNDLRAARRRADRSDVAILIVTLDPWRDTPERLATLAKHWSLGANDRVLSGPVEDVEAVLDALGVARRRNETTGDVDHATTVFVLGSDGRIGWRGDGGIGGVEGLLALRAP
jgi:cytochrome oxidase Cu insertion factor (SCO1/SenC/PrrC family)